MTILMNRKRPSNYSQHSQSSNNDSNKTIRLSDTPAIPTKRTDLSVSNNRDLVNILWNGKDDETTRSNINGIQLTCKDFRTLKHGEWLNDQVIDAYMELIKKRSVSNPQMPKTHAFSAFFYTALCKKGYEGVSRWTSKIDIFDFDILLFPIHTTDHWSLVAVHLKKDLIGYFDSMQFLDDKSAVAMGKLHIKMIYKYMKTESLQKRGIPYLRNNSKASTFNQPHQQNENDCGVFVSIYAENIARDRFGEFEFEQRDIPRMRRQMCFELGTGSLIKQ